LLLVTASLLCSIGVFWNFKLVFPSCIFFASV
jgi:hypothetical protein